VIPEFVSRLRKSVGPDELLWLAGVNAVVCDAVGRVLLQQNSDNHRWSILSGILHPGEEPATGVCREIFEETGVVASADRLVGVTVSPIRRHANGDVAQYLELTFRCTALAGEARVADDESDAVGWYALDALPPMEAQTLMKIELALSARTDAWFATSDWSPSPDAAGL
jgi:8-oxo-dGTP pyrophosphatase MutT (NUDIX family)